MLQSVGGLVPFHFIPKQCYWFRSYQEAAMQSWEGFYIAVSVSESPGAIFAINAVGKISHSTYLHISASIARSSNCKTNLILCFLYFYFLRFTCTFLGKSSAQSCNYTRTCICFALLIRPDRTFDNLRASKSADRPIM